MWFPLMLGTALAGDTVWLHVGTNTTVRESYALRPGVDIGAGFRLGDAWEIEIPLSMSPPVRITALPGDRRMQETQLAVLVGRTVWRANARRHDEPMSTLRMSGGPALSERIFLQGRIAAVTKGPLVRAELDLRHQAGIGLAVGVRADAFTQVLYLGDHVSAPSRFAGYARLTWRFSP